MKPRHRSILLCLLMSVLFPLSFFTGVALAQGEPCESCSGGENWVNNCPAGTDSIGNHNGYVELELPAAECTQPPIDIQLDSVCPLAVRHEDGEYDVMETEIIEMCLTGGSVTLRAGDDEGVNADLLPSLGFVVDRREPPVFPADSFFDMYFEMDFGDGTYLYNQEPLRLESVIYCMPPGPAEYVNAQGECLALYTDPTPGQGVHMANLMVCRLNVNPGATPVPEASWGMIKALYR